MILVDKTTIYQKVDCQYLCNLFFPNAEYQFSILPIPIRISILCIIVLFLFFLFCLLTQHVYLSSYILIKRHIKHLKIQIYLPLIRKLICFTYKRAFIRSQCVLVNFVLMRYYQVGKRLILFIFISITTPLTVYKQFNLSK